MGAGPNPVSCILLKSRADRILARDRFMDEITLIAPDGTEAVGISLWDRKKNAAAYYRTTYPHVLELLAEGITPVRLPRAS